MMIKLNASIQRTLILTFSAIALILVMGYSLLSARYFMDGMDTVIGENLVRAATVFSNGENANDVSTFESYTVTREWSAQPGPIRATIPTPPSIHNVLQKATFEGKNGQPDQMFFFMAVDTANGLFYTSFHIPPDKVSGLVFRNVRDSLVTLIAIGLATAICLALVVWWLMYRLTKPVTRLGIWARALNEQTLDDDIPDFEFRDLNQFAAVVRNSLISVKEGLDREQAFLRQASHELRTPISVIRSNIELLHKLKSIQSDKGQDLRETDIVNRIDRASLTMKSLTETLLWLGREDGKELPNRNVRLDILVESIISDLNYLLNGKSVRLSVHTSPCTCELPETAACIVLSNLIRNAFQHTLEGEIFITQDGCSVDIDNYEALEAGQYDDLGFGLGLKLVEKLTNKLGWELNNIARQNGRSARLYFKNASPHSE